MPELDEIAIISMTVGFVQDRLSMEPTGHDWWHADRVRRLAIHIGQDEGADLFVIELAALLHDIADFKFTGSDETGPTVARQWLFSLGTDPLVVDAVSEIVGGVSFKGAGVEEFGLSLEGKCVRDADRLDSMGAIGIARTFAYGGYVRRPIHDPHQASVYHTTAEEYESHLGTSINHFYEKLLLLQGRLHTNSARKIAAERHAFMMRFLSQFYREWDADLNADAELRALPTVRS